MYLLRGRIHYRYGGIVGPGQAIQLEPGIDTVPFEEIKVLDTDTLVLSYWRKAETGLYDALKDRIDIHRIGDALSPRRRINAIYEGYKTAMEI